MRVLIILLLSHIIVMLVHTAGLAIAGRIAKASILEIAIFTGPALIKIKIRGVAFRLNLLPIGSYVHYATALDASDPDGAKLLKDLHPLTRAIIASSGCIALLLLGAACLGTAVTQHTMSGFSQIIMGALSPLAYGAQLLQQLYQFASTEPLFATLGLVASKETAFNLLPIPVLNGGDIIINLVSIVKPISDPLKAKLNMLGLLLMLGIWACWIVALVYFLSR
jgi:membrane-associated protease RseP (regulator of RpoE activity)